MLSKIKKRIEPWIESSARPFVRLGLCPNHITFIALIVGILGGFLFSIGATFWAALVVLVGGFFDMIDGAVARLTNKVTRLGGVLDSVLDRITDSAVFVGIMGGGMAGLAGQPAWLLPALALVGSLLVSYTRARAESAGTGKLDVGIAERAERLLILAIGAFLNVITYALVIIVVLTAITVVQRVWEAHRRLAVSAETVE